MRTALLGRDTAIERYLAEGQLFGLFLTPEELLEWYDLDLY